MIIKIFMTRSIIQSQWVKQAEVSKLQKQSGTIRVNYMMQKLLVYVDSLTRTAIMHH